jgi:uncharacterized membrane protein HdeD (DUF308 family)
MLRMLADNWWVLLIRGIAAILFGILAFLWPGLTIAVLVLMFGAYALVDGIFSIIAAFAASAQPASNRWLIGLGGLVSIIFGILVFFWPGITAVVLLYMIAAWAIITGIISIIAAIQLRREIEGEWWMIIGGVLSILFGVLAFLYPGATALSLILVIAAYTVVFGIVMVILSFRVRGLRNQLPA